MIDKTLVSKENLKSISYSVFQDLITKIKNKDISLPYTAQLSKSSYLKIDGLGNMFLNNNGNYIDLGNMDKDKLDIDKICSIFNIVQNKGDVWCTNYNNMPTGKSFFGFAQYNGKIYCISEEIQAYDITSNTWSTNYNTMPTIRSYFGCVQYNGKIYCIGGYNRSYTNIVEVYDILSNTWSTNYNNMPTSRGVFGCIEYNGKIYCIGGNNGYNLDIVEVYDITSNTWSTNYNHMPTIREEFGCIDYNGKIYCIGGTNNSTSNNVEVYDIASNTWGTNYNNMPTGRSNFGCIEYNGKIYCIGGTNTIRGPYPNLNITEVYDISNNTWYTNYKSMITSRWAFGCVYYDDKIYCIGGYSNINIVESYQLPYSTFNIPMPDFLYYKLNEIITNGDGTKIFHNNGKYTTITPSYEVMDNNDIIEIIDYCTI